MKIGGPSTSAAPGTPPPKRPFPWVGVTIIIIIIITLVYVFTLKRVKKGGI